MSVVGAPLGDKLAAASRSRLDGLPARRETPAVASPRRALVAIVVAAAVLRMLAAAVRPSWHDEYFTAWVAGQGWGGVVAALRADSGPPLPYAAVKLLAATGLEAITAGRCLAVVLGVAAVLLTWRACRRTWGEEPALWSASLLAVHPLAVAWSSEARAYPWVLFAATWAWERIEAGRSGGRASAAGLGAAVAVACWSHALGLVLTATLAVVALTLPRPARGRALAATALGLATSLPWLPIALRQPPAAVAWVAEAWQAMPDAERLLAPLRLLPTLAPFGARLDLVSAPAALQALAAAVALVALLAARWPLRPALLALVPAVALGGTALLGAAVYYPSRGEALWLAPSLALVGAGLARVRAGRWLGALLLAGGVATIAASAAAWHRLPPSSESRLAAAVSAALPGGGVVVVSGPWRLGLWAALGDGRERWRLLAVPAASAPHPGWSAPALEPLSGGELATLRGELATALRRRTAVAFVVAPDPAAAPQLERLAADLGCPSRLALPVAHVLGPCAGP